MPVILAIGVRATQGDPASKNNKTKTMGNGAQFEGAGDVAEWQSTFLVCTRPRFQPPALKGKEKRTAPSIPPD
jgi:hypothetical protein